MLLTFPSRSQFISNPSAKVLLKSLEEIEELTSGDALLYLNYPLYRDDGGGVVVPDALLISKLHGAIGFSFQKNQADLIERQRCEVVPGNGARALLIN